MILLWGSNAREAHPIFFHHVLKAVHAGAGSTSIDPRRTTSAAAGPTRWLGLNVGSDIALANAMAREIIHAGLANREFIERATTGFDAYAAGVERYTLDHAEQVTGVPGRGDPRRRPRLRPRRSGADLLDARASPSTTTPSTTCWR